MIIDEQVYLDHSGVKGMKWGVRRTKNEQKHIDSIRRVAEGGGNKRDKLGVHLIGNPYVIGAHGLSKAAARILDKNQDYQKKVALGKYKTTESLNKGILGFRASEINYSYDKSHVNKLKTKSKGAQITLGILSSVGHVGLTGRSSGYYV